VQTATRILTVTGVANQLGYGERQAPIRAGLRVQAESVAQFQLDHAEGVAPAQIIFSGEQGQRTAIVLKSAVPAAAAISKRPSQTAQRSAAIRPRGRVNSNSLPALLQLIGKYYNGSDLRFLLRRSALLELNDTLDLPEPLP